MKLAKFRCFVSESCSYEAIYDEERAKYLDPKTTRLSECVEVTFPSRPQEEIVPERLATLDRAEAELRAKFQLKLNEIAEERAKLRALTWDGAAA